MKKLVISVLFVALTAMLSWNCNKDQSVNEQSGSLKTSLNTSVQSLNTALTDIAATKGYQVLNMSDANSLKSTTTDQYKVYITLDTIAGDYSYKPTQVIKRGIPIIKFFNKTAASNIMVLRIPSSKLKDPKSLSRYNAADTALTNNFVVTVSDYHNNYNSFLDYDYKNVSAVSIDNVSASSLNVTATVKYATFNYVSSYDFGNGYKAVYTALSGDTISTGYALYSGDKVVYEEKVLRTKPASTTVKPSDERQFILTIGDVTIKRGKDLTKAEVYLAGVLQTKATVEIVDKETVTEPTACKKRDIKITFDDGTSALVSNLVGNASTNIVTLFASLKQVYFATNVIDWIAYDIYYNRK